MRNKVVVFLALIVLVVLITPQKGKPMALNFNGVGGYYYADSFTPLDNWTTISMSSRISSYTLPADNQNFKWTAYAAHVSGTFTNREAFQVYSWRVTGGSYRLYFSAARTTAPGIWYAPIDNTINNTITVTYDNSSASNDPVMYINGSSVSVTEEQAPSGSFPSAAVDRVMCGAYSTAGWTPSNFTLYNCFVNNVVLTATEAYDIYASRKAFPVPRGLIFSPFLLGAKGLQDGDSLASGKTIPDYYGEWTYDFTGSGAMKADTYLNWR